MLLYHNYIHDYRLQLPDLLLFLCSGNQIEKVKLSLHSGFWILGRFTHNKNKGEGEVKINPHCLCEMSILSHPHLQHSHLMDTDSEAKNIYLKCDVLAVLFSFLFQLLKNLMHSEPDHDPGTASIPILGKGICSSGVRYKASELVLDFFFLNWCSAGNTAQIRQT